MLIVEYYSDMLAAWRNEDLTKLDVIKGYTTLLLEGEFGPLTDKQHQAIETIHRCCTRTVTGWHDRGAFIYHGGHDPVSLDEVINDVLRYMRGWLLIDTGNVHITLADNLPQVLDGPMLVIAIVGIIKHVHRPNQDGFSATFRASSNQQGTILVQIQIQSKNDSNEVDLISALSRPDTDLGMANLLIQQLIAS